MKTKNERHLSDVELLQYVDGELNRPRVVEIQAHLAACWECRSRRSQIDLTIQEFMQFQRASSDASQPDASVYQFRSRLSRLVAAQRTNRWEGMFYFVRRAGRPVSLCLLLATLLAVSVNQVFVRNVHADESPNSRLTPGAVRSVSREEICRLNEAELGQSIPDRLAFRVFDKYGIHDPQPRTYEVDYLISPSLGGSDDLQNLWPEPYAKGVWNAHVKDALEDRLHELVCDGRIELSTAQQDIASNWIQAYKKYFHTEHPLELHAGFSKDPPWE